MHPRFFIPIGNLFDCNTAIYQCNNFVDAFGIMTTYFIVISGWLGYHHSIKKHPHIRNIGLLRYFLDLVILFLVYYMVSIANPQSTDYYGMIFLWIIPSTFLCYSIWDILKFYEYRNEKLEVRVPEKRMKISVLFGIPSICLSMIYYFIDLNLGNQFVIWENKSSLDFVFMIAFLMLFIIYRLIKRTGESIDERSSFKL